VTLFETGKGAARYQSASAIRHSQSKTAVTVRRNQLSLAFGSIVASSGMTTTETPGP